MSTPSLQAHAPTFFQWFKQKGYPQGIFWILLVSLTSNMNDILMRLAGSLPAMEITFFRYFFAMGTLLPLMIFKGKTAFHTTRPFLHGVRSLLLFAAIACWAHSVSMVPLAVVSTMALTVPIIVLPLAALILKEKVGIKRTIATLVGFLGIFYVVTNGFQQMDILHTASQNRGTLYLAFAALCFALSDIVNKKYVIQESTLSMLFYIALGTALISLVPTFGVWVTPSLTQLVYLFILGAGGNLILLFLLKAFAATDVSALAPYRYAELIFATFLAG